MRWFAAAREWLRGLLFRGREDADLDEEIRFHLDMEAEQLMREREMPPRAARRRARAAFGGVGRTKAEVRRARGAPSLSGVPLDVRLGLRMLAKYPGLSVVGVTSMAVVIAVGAVLHVAAGFVDPPLPFEGGDRAVAIEYWDTEVGNQERRILHDLVDWKEALTTVEEVGAWTPVRRNVVTPDGRTEALPIAEMSASGFRVASARPLDGRPLLESDEREGAPPVVVIGHDLWRDRFAGDSTVVGTTVHIGGVPHTVVGVMPEGFAFPVKHDLWTPLRADPTDWKRREGPRIWVFGRLAPGATLDAARAELSAMGERMAAAMPETHRRLRPAVMPYTRQILDDMTGAEVPAAYVGVALLLLLICTNVAVLVYARSATRRGEIAVRTALGASRRRVVGQLAVEALVLSAVAAVVGLGLAAVALRQIDRAFEPLIAIPFWVDFALTPGAVAWAGILALAGAVVVGVLPALKVTGSRLHGSLQSLSSGSTDASGLRFGGVWTALIVVQVAFTVAIAPAAVVYGGVFLRHGTMEPGFAAQEYLTARLTLEGTTTDELETRRPELEARFDEVLAVLVERVGAEPSVSDVVVTSTAPGMEGTSRVEVEAVGVGEGRGSGGGVSTGRVGVGRVGPGFFRAFDLPVVAGRTFHEGDLDPAATAVVVNESFVREIFGGANGVGRRVGYAGEDDPVRYEIVGVVGDLGNAMEPDRARAKLYHPVEPGWGVAQWVTLRVRGMTPGAFAPRLREIAASVDPALVVREPLSLEAVLREEQTAMRMGALAIGLVTLSVLVLTLAGIHALMSFTVAQRRREIGIRAALGAHPRRILAGIFSRSLAQLGVGFALGVVPAAGLLTADGPLDRTAVLALVVVAAALVGVGLLATLGPAQRGLAIQPTEALKEG